MPVLQPAGKGFPAAPRSQMIAWSSGLARIRRLSTLTPHGYRGTWRPTEQIPERIIGSGLCGPALLARSYRHRRDHPLCGQRPALRRKLARERLYRSRRRAAQRRAPVRELARPLQRQGSLGGALRIGHRPARRGLRLIGGLRGDYYHYSARALDAEAEALSEGSGNDAILSPKVQLASTTRSSSMPAGAAAPARPAVGHHDLVVAESRQRAPVRRRFQCGRAERRQPSPRL